jgi:hypothetical protein
MYRQKSLLKKYAFDNGQRCDKNLFLSAKTTSLLQTFRSEEPSNEILQKILAYRWHATKKEEARNT